MTDDEDKELEELSKATQERRMPPAPRDHPMQMTAIIVLGLLTVLIIGALGWYAFQ